MSDTNEKEAALETEAENSMEESVETATPDAPEQQPGKQATPSSPIPLVLSLVAILGLAGGGFWAWKAHQGLQQQLDQAIAQTTNELQGRIAEQEQSLQAESDALSKLKTGFDGQQAAFKEQKSRFEQERNRLKQREAQIKTELEGVHRRIGRSSSQWMAAEAEYLIRVANHRLRLERDITTALTALQGADGRLAATNDPIWTNAREALASEMAALRTLAKVDIIGLTANIASLTKRVDKLRLVGAQPLTPGGKALAEGVKIEGISLEDILQQGWEGFRSLVVIRKHDEPVTAMLPPEQRYFVYQNLRLQLEAARLAVLRADPDLYASSLQTTDEWIKEFIILEDAEAQAMLDEIAKLAKINIRPELPDISNSLRLLRDSMEAAATGGATP
jgi:uroporphyrin-3 C-methyltransferase